MSKTRHQHYVPNFLLKRWKDENSNILLLGKTELKTIKYKDNKNYFAKDWLYELDITPSIRLEEKLSKIETNYAVLTASKQEYELHKIMNSPKFFLVHTIRYRYWFNVILFEKNVFPISQFGKFKCAWNHDDNYFFIQPISPNIAFIIMPYEIFNKNQTLLNDMCNNIDYYGKIFAFNELATLSKWICVPNEWKDTNLLEKFVDYNKNYKVWVKIPDENLKVNKIYSNKQNGEKYMNPSLIIAGAIEELENQSTPLSATKKGKLEGLKLAYTIVESTKAYEEINRVKRLRNACPPKTELISIATIVNIYGDEEWQKDLTEFMNEQK